MPDTRLVSVQPKLVRVILHVMTTMSRFILLLGICLSTVTSTLAQSGIWVDVVPMTRRLFGADDAQDVAFGIGWSAQPTAAGFRTLIGFDLGQETQDSFGTTIITRNRRANLRTGYRWRLGEASEERLCWATVGIDLLLNGNHIGTESSNLDFRSTNTTTTIETGLGGVLGVQCRIADGFHLVTEARMDGVYLRETNRISDNFGGNFEETDNGWNARLNPPLQLMLVISL